MATVDRSLVANLPLFAGLRRRRSSTQSCARRARPAIAKNSAVFEQGEDAHSFFVLLHGHVRASKTTPAGQQVVVRYVAPGETFGVAMAIGLTQLSRDRDRGRRQRRARLAVGGLAAPGGAAFPALATNTLQTVGSRLQETHTRVVEMSTAAGRAARRARAAAARQAGRPQGRAWRRDRFSDQPAGHRRDDRHHAAHGQPHPRAAGSSRGWSRAAASASCCASRISCSLLAETAPGEASRRSSHSSGDGAHAARRGNASAIDAVLAAGIVDAWKPAIGQPTQPIRKSRNTRIVAGQRRITSSTRRWLSIGMSASTLAAGSCERRAAVLFAPAQPRGFPTAHREHPYP